MSVPSGTKLGVFEISTLLGVGGMGEVYRARDTKLGRDVAIKILPAEFAHDRDRLARFQREARLLAALNHPNIAQIHELQESDGVQFLVMELVGGMTLADRLKGGPLALEEILKLFGQIADGLDAAHQQGVIHRDLKPANIKINDDGKVSLLDFGLAKAAELQSSSTDAEVTSPWNADGAGTSCEGQVLGTPAYMSPEQARGKPVDKRTDIWAFGCCLYESLTGHRPFHGETGSDTLAKILTAEPGWERLPKRTPSRLRELLARCLAKDLKSRLRDIGDARLELGQIASNPSISSTATALPEGVIGVRRTQFVALILGAMIFASLAGAAVWSVLRPDPASVQASKNNRGVIRTTMELPAETPIRATFGARIAGAPRFALSPNGSRLVFMGSKEGETMLYLRPMDRLQSSPLPGTLGGHSPFFSPDGQWVGFFAGGKLKKIRIGGSQPVVLCDARTPMGAAWGRDGTIYFAESASEVITPLNRGLKRVRDSGGAPELLTHNESDVNVIGHAWPCALPDGKSVLFSLNGISVGSGSIAALSLKTGKWKIVLRQATGPRYVPTGHLLFRSPAGGSMYAARFDLDSLQVVGPRIPVLQSDLAPGLSDTGCLVHTPTALRESDDGQFPACPLVWVNRDGETEPLKAPIRPYFGARLSPDGNRLGVTIATERGYDIGFYDLERETLSRLNFEGSNRAPVWTPDGQRVVFSTDHGGKAFNLFSAPADGSAQPQRLTQSDANQFATSVTPDGRTLAFLELQPSTGGDIYTLPLDGSGKAEPLIRSEFFEAAGAFSPDGRWLAYNSDETGRPEVFVQRYPDLAAKWQISNQGGYAPRWSPKGDQLFYRYGAGILAVSIETEPDFKPGRPQLVFEKPLVESSVTFSYDVSRDGHRFVMPGLPEGDATAVHKLIVVQNWFEELERLVPPVSAAEQSAR